MKARSTLKHIFSTKNFKKHKIPRCTIPKKQRKKTKNLTQAKQEPEIIVEFDLIRFLDLFFIGTFIYLIFRMLF